MRTPPHVTVIGFGELGSAIARRLAVAGIDDVSVYCRGRPEPQRGRLARRIAASGVRPVWELREALRGADVVVSAVPTRAASEVAHACAGRLEAGAVYVDVSATAPVAKATAAAELERVGGRYVDVAVMGTVVASGHAVPMLASGAHARAWADFACPRGLTVTAVDGPPGRASLIKLLRSVYMKGRDALILETIVAARRYGVEQELMPTIAGPGEEVAFPQLADRVLCSLSLHAGRRADELQESAALLRGVGVEPSMTVAAAEWLRWLAALGLRDRFGGERPDGLAEVLDAIDDLSAREASG